MKAENLYGSFKAEEAAPPELFGQVVLSKHSFEECEALMIASVPKNLAEKEAELVSVKWFDYRRLHPIMATLLFVKHYSRAYGNFLAETNDRGMRYVAAVRGKDIFAEKHRDRLTFWKLRQLADSYGMRYEVFTNAVMRHYISEGWLQAPRPAHVLNTPEAHLRALNSWGTSKQEIGQWSELPFYRVTNWTGHPDQLAYEDSIVAFIKSRGTKRYALHAALYEHDALRIERAIAEFGPEVIEEAIEISLQK